MPTRRQVLTSLPVFAAALLVPVALRAQPLGAPDLQHVTLSRLTDVFWEVERWDRTVDVVHVNPRVFDHLARQARQKGLLRQEPQHDFELWSARFVSQPGLEVDEIEILNLTPGHRAGFFLRWSTTEQRKRAETLGLVGWDS